MSVLLVILGLLSLLALIVAHEWGHFKAARKNGVDVEEFGIGFPPKVWGKTVGKGKGKFLFSVNLLPLGGFVRLKGEHDIDQRSGSFGAAPLKAKVKIMTAGVFMNLVIAFGLLGIGAIIGMPQVLPNQFNVESDSRVVRQDVLVGYMEEGSPADKAGLQPQDVILEMKSSSGDKLEVEAAESIPDFTSANAGQAVVITYQRDGETLNAEAELRSEAEVEASKKTDNPVGYLGIIPSEYVVKRATWSAPIVAGGTIVQFTYETLRGIGSALYNLAFGNRAAAGDQVTGPIGIFVVMRDGSVLGPEFMVFLTAVISLTLAIMNILPVPALDGGRLFVTLLFRYMKRPLTPELEDRIHTTGFVFLLGLIVLITIVDINRFFG